MKDIIEIRAARTYPLIEVVHGLFVVIQFSRPFLFLN